MGTAQLREELHKYIDQADDQVLRLVKRIFQTDDSDNVLKVEMLRRAEASERDIAEGRTISAAEFKLRLEDWKMKKRSNT
ncbi:MAG: hypothetical protein AAF551_09460 [Bacteroidota bacterium]